MEKNIRELASFNMAIDSKLRGCDLVNLRVSDVMPGGKFLNRTIINQQKTMQPVHFEITEQTRDSLSHLISEYQLSHHDYFLKVDLKSLSIYPQVNML